MAQDPKLASILKAYHKEFEGISAHLQDFMNWYENESISSYLFKHTRESQTDFDNRKKRSFWFDYCSPIIDLYVSYIFKKPIIRIAAKEEEGQLKPDFTPPPSPFGQGQSQGTGMGMGEEFPSPEALAEPKKPAKMPTQKKSREGEEIQTFWRNVDKKKTPIHVYMKEVSTMSQIFGYYGVLLDMPRAYNKIITEEQRKENMIRPYCTKVDPRQIINWEMDNETFLWVRLKEDPPALEDPFAERPKPEDMPDYYLTWTRNGWFRHKVLKEEVTLVDAGDNPIGEVPLVIVYNVKSKNKILAGRSALQEIGPINVAILNWLSLVDEDIYQKCLSILTLQTTNVDAKPAVEIGNNNVLTYTGNIPPQFIVNPSTANEFILKMITSAVTEIYRIARLGGFTGIEQRKSSSGVAYGYEFNETNQALSDKADNLEKAESEICRLYLKWLGMEWTGSINYPDDFSIESFKDEIRFAIESKGAVRSATFKREVEKSMVRKVMPKLDKKYYDVIDTEIKEMPEEKPFSPFGGM